MSLLIALLAFTSIAHGVEPVPLRAGPVTMVFDAENAFLRYVRIGPHEVLRGINAPIRDQNWATVAPRVSQLRVENRGDSFHVTFDVRCQEADIDSSDTLAAVGLALRKPGRMRVLIGNLSSEPQAVTLRGLSGKPVAIQLLGAKPSHATPELRISLPPYGIARIDPVVD